MTVHTKILLYAAFLLLQDVYAANILFIAPLPSPSHHIWNKALSLGLIEHDHNITMLSHDSDKSSDIKNFTVIKIEGLYEAIQELYNVSATDDVKYEEPNKLISIKSMYDFVAFCCNHDINSKGLQTLLDYPKDYKFDLIIFDVTVGQCLYPLIERFHNPLVVAVTPFLLPPVFSHVFGNSLHTSYMPYYGSEFTNKMSITERFLNFIYVYAEVIYRDYVAMPMLFELAKQRFGENIQTLENLERNISLLLANFDPVMSYPATIPPNIIPVGGLQIKPAGTLPEDLRKIIDNAKEGVIFFSLGTNMRSDMLKPTDKKALLDAFGKLPQLVIWKFESDNLDVPKNVILRKWLPQNDILGHPNVKLFISHGGALSTQEAIYHGVPVIGIPFFADQHINIRIMEEKGLAKTLDKEKLTAEKIYGTIKQVLDSPAFADNIRVLSRLYRDQPQTALERGVFWIEHVLRHGSAEHLGLASRDMPFYQTNNLDILALFILILLAIYSISLFILAGCRLIFSAKSIKAERKSVK